MTLPDAFAGERPEHRPPVDYVEVFGINIFGVFRVDMLIAECNPAIIHFKGAA
jgi:hypothetical protein